MPVIHRLDNHTINQIAAGEVVERPSSVVKELVENSIDAGASAITIETEKGGTSFIRVTDNGTGMDYEDALICFERHATSKIKGPSDLESIISLGFRGEALASISSVSHTEIFTRRTGALSGFHIINQGGQITNAAEAGCPEGTTVIVRNLFYNTPARMKFLKSERAETAFISELAAKLILAHPEISIKYINNGKEVYRSPGSGDLISAIVSVYGKEIRNEIISVEYAMDAHGLAVHGYAGKPSLARANRSHQSFFVNGRYIKDKLLSQCIEEAAKDQTMINHYPWCVLNLSVPPQDIDVNVHPSKTEIRFRNPELLYDKLLNILQESIKVKPYVPPAVISAPLPEYKADEEDNNHENNYEYRSSQLIHSVNTDNSEQIDAFDQSAIPGQKTGIHTANEETAKYNYTEEPAAPKEIYINNNKESINAQNNDNTIDGYDFMKMKIIGSVFATYIIVETDQNMYLIDQHAAHERLIYERLKEAAAKKNVLSQQILPPLVLETTHDEYIAIADSLEVFESIGFDIEDFGGKSFIIRGVPVLLHDADIKSLFHEVLDRIGSKQGNLRQKIEEDDIIMMSCKSAVKANNSLTDIEIRSLLAGIDSKKIPLTCPHGRPILISISRYELEKNFKRIQ